MNLGQIGRSTAAAIMVGAAISVCALTAGCTADPAPTPTPTPTVSQTPIETTQERQERLDYAAAEKAYRTFRAEYRRVLRGGGASAATATMKATAGDGYLRDTEDVVQGYKRLGYHQEGAEDIVYVRFGGYSETSLILAVCEDDRAVKALDKKGKSLGPGEFRTVQIEVQKKNLDWKLWSGSGKKVDSCG